jgi:hypothetical protein
MEHKRVDQLRSVADVQPTPSTFMSRRERLERWAELLEQEPQRRLKSLEEIELAPRRERPLMRANNSPLTVAFEDPILRANGLASDRLGDAMAFFELSENEAHRVLCSCLNGRTMEAGTTARRVRAIANRTVPSLSTALIIAGAATGIPALIYLIG